MNRLLRLGGSMLVATALVFVTIAVVMRLFDPPQAIEDAVYDELIDDVAVVDLDADPALRQAFEDSLRAKSAKRVSAEPPPKPRVLVPPREVSGFVQLELELDERGQVVDARVLGAVPAGRYEAQALAEVRGRRYPPLVVDGKPTRGKVTEIVDFKVPAEAPARKP
jgi:hypothetical protein